MQRTRKGRVTEEGLAELWDWSTRHEKPWGMGISSHVAKAMVEEIREHRGEGEPVGWVLQVQVNPGRPSAYWRIDSEVEIRDTAEEAWADYDELEREGFVPEHLRVVALTVVSRPEGSSDE